MIKLKNIITEALSPIVYHYISPFNLYNSLLSNEKQLPAAFGTKADFQYNKKKLYFLSTSRIKFGGYTRSNFYKKNICVTLVLNGEKLNQNYKGTSVDYWGKAYRDAALGKDTDTFLRQDENEDRLITDKPSIKNFKKYILEIHIFIPSNDGLNAHHTHYLEKINELFSPIYYYYYNEETAFKTLNKLKASTKLTLIPTDEKMPEPWPERTPYKGAFYSALEIYNCNNQNDLKNLSDYSKDMVQKLQHKDSFYVKDYKASIEADIHNDRNSGPERQNIIKLGNIMKKLKITSVNDFLMFLGDKITKIKSTNPDSI